MACEALFEPVRIGSLELKNRIALAPMNMGYTGPMGYPSEDGLAYYSTRARGGFGLIITETGTGAGWVRWRRTCLQRP